MRNISGILFTLLALHCPEKHTCGCGLYTLQLRFGLVEYVALRIPFPPYSIIGKGANLGKLPYSTMPTTPNIRVGGLKFGL